MSQEITATLVHWHIEHCTDDEFIIWGDIYDDIHSRWLNGERMHTSGIMYSEHTPRNLSEGDIVKTRNSVYALGKPL